MKKRTVDYRPSKTIKLVQNDNFYVITGGPGVGKTTLIEELHHRHFEIVPEIARELIKEQVETNSDALPWKDRESYKNLMFDRSIKSYAQLAKNASKENPIFFDRGFLDAICYSNLIRSEVSEQMNSFAENWRYNKTVFILPPWREIYKTDNERKQDWIQALLTHDKMVETYENYGYDIVEVPRIAVFERADFITGHIETCK